MLTIQLHNLIFHAYHGLYEEEKIIGNDFEINMEVSFDELKKITDINETIDYVSIHGIIKKIMDNSTPLMETVVQEMVEQIKLFDARVVSVMVNIKKLNPAIANFNGTVGIAYTKVF